MTKYVNAEEVLKGFPKEEELNILYSEYNQAIKQCRQAVENAPSIRELTVEDVNDLICKMRLKQQKSSFAILFHRELLEIKDIAQAIVKLHKGE